MPDQVGRRNTQRLKLAAEARLVSRNGTHLVQLTDISVTGAHLTHKRIEPFTWCVLQWLGHEVDGRMVWINHEQCGIRFAKALPEEVLLVLREKFPEIDEKRRLPVADRRRWI